jgi:hypothetical protein
MARFHCELRTFPDPSRARQKPDNWRIVPLKMSCKSHPRFRAFMPRCPRNFILSLRIAGFAGSGSIVAAESPRDAAEFEELVENLVLNDLFQKR